MADLKPCPFCGGEAMLIKPMGKDIWAVGCDDGLCPGNVWKIAPLFYTRELAIRYWNGRKNDA